MMTLGEKQRLFCSLVAKLLTWIYANGYECSFGETKRSDEQAEINALGHAGRAALTAVLRAPGNGNVFSLLADKIDNNTGSGIRNTLHELQLAIDLQLFVAGKYVTDGTKYEPLGKYWESLHPLCVWGGRFNDGNHFSITHEGRK